MWGERGLVATLFSDLAQENASILKKFIEMIELADGSLGINFNSEEMWCVIEPDFGNRGFGSPDAVIRITNKKDKSIVIIFEAKRTTYERSSWDLNRKQYDSGFNSSINGQLELNYCLTLALQQFKKDELIEPNWIINAYQGDRDVLGQRRLVNKHVLNKIAKQIANLNLQCYYHVILTDDDSNPFLKRKNLPRLFDQHNQDQWESVKKNFGWLNFERINEFAKKHFSNEEYLATWELNKGNMNHDHISIEGPRGYSIIYIPDVIKETYVHYSYLGESAALRIYGDSKSDPRIVRDYASSWINSRKKDEVIPDMRKPVTDTAYWHEYIKKLNTKNL